MPLAAFPKCFLSQLTLDGTMTVEEWIDLAAGLDIDGLEFYWGFTPRDADGIARVRAHLAERGLSVPMMCYSSDFTHLDPAERELAVRAQVEAIAVTSSLGGQYCRVLSGQCRPGVTVQEGVRWVTDCILACLPAAERFGVTLVFENHFKDGFWKYPEFAQAPEVFLEILAGIPETPFFGVNFDPSNAITAGASPVELLEQVLPRVVSMHASDRHLRPGATVNPATGTYDYEDLVHGVIGSGLVSYDELFDLLSRAGFQGWISIEDGDDPEVGMEHLRSSAEFLRRKMREHGLR